MVAQDGREWRFRTDQKDHAEGWARAFKNAIASAVCSLRVAWWHALAWHSACTMSQAPPVTPLNKMEGALVKEGAKFKTWKNRWFVLEGRRLMYFKKLRGASPGRACAGVARVTGAPGETLGVVELIPGSRVTAAARDGHEFTFELVVQHKSLWCSAKDAATRDEWVTAIHRSIAGT